MKRALITGVTGQDGSYLAEFLLSKGYEVHGLIRRSSSFNTQRIEHLYRDPHEEGIKLFLHYGDLSDPGALNHIIWNIKPDEIYNLAAQSHVKVSFDMPEYTSDVTGLGTTRILETLRRSGMQSRFYQASSSEMFGLSPPPQSEGTPFHPRSPYAASKAYSYWMVVNYREAYGLFLSNGILFNHESPRRGETFVTRKITRAVARILAGRQEKLFLGNLSAGRDWGFACEYAEAMWKILQQDKPDDFVIGTGEGNSVRDFAAEAFSYAGIEIEWRGEGLEEKGIVISVDSKETAEYPCDLKEGSVIIEVDPAYFRPSETAEFIADVRKAKRVLGWSPRVEFKDLVRIMVDYDMEAAGLLAPGEGHHILKSKGFDYLGCSRR